MTKLFANQFVYCLQLCCHLSDLSLRPRSHLTTVRSTRFMLPGGSNRGGDTVMHGWAAQGRRVGGRGSARLTSILMRPVCLGPWGFSY